LKKVYKNNLQELRWERQWSQEQLARISGISRSSIQAIENGTRIPSVSTALKLSKAFNATVEDIFTL